MKHASKIIIALVFILSISQADTFAQPDLHERDTMTTSTTDLNSYYGFAHNPDASARSDKTLRWTFAWLQEWIESIVSSSSSGGGNVYKSGTPSQYELAAWSNDSTVYGITYITFDGTDFDVAGNVVAASGLEGESLTMSAAGFQDKLVYFNSSGVMTAVPSGTVGQLLQDDGDGTYSFVTASGTGDMTKAVYDTDDDGVADNADSLAGVVASDYLDRSNHTGTQAASTIGSGTFTDARIAESNVTQHEAAITITESQISDLGSYLTSEVDGSTTNEIQDLSLTSNTLSLSGDGTSVDLSGYLDNTDTQLTDEEVEDVVGAMVSGNTETGITVTYQDSDGTFDFAVDEGSLSITESQISDLDHFTAADINGNETAFNNWDKDDTDDFSGIFADLTSKPTTLSGYGITDAQGLDADLTAIGSLSTVGLIKRTGAGTASIITDNSSAWNTALQTGDNVSDLTNDAGYLTSEVDGSTTNEIQDLSLTSNTLSLSGDGTSVDLSGYLDNTDTQLTDEQVQDKVGSMFSGNTETLITLTYQDGDGTVDAVVDDDLSNYDNTTSGFVTAADVGVSGLTDNRIIRANGTNELQGSTVEITDDGDLNLTGSDDRAIQYAGSNMIIFNTSNSVYELPMGDFHVTGGRSMYFGGSGLSGFSMGASTWDISMDNTSESNPLFTPRYTTSGASTDIAGANLLSLSISGTEVIDASRNLTAVSGDFSNDVTIAESTNGNITLESTNTTMANNQIIGRIDFKQGDTADPGVSAQIISRIDGSSTGSAELEFWTGTPSSSILTLLLSDNGNSTFNGNIFDSGSNTVGIDGNRWTNGYFTDFTTTNAVNVDSDSTYKKNIIPIPSAIAQINSMNPVSYQWKSRENVNTDDVHYGLIAQELELILPDLVNTNPETGKKSVVYTELIPFLIKAVQDQQAQIEALAARIEDLEE